MTGAQTPERSRSIAEREAEEEALNAANARASALAMAETAQMRPKSARIEGGNG